jgi:hypothetical protein
MVRLSPAFTSAGDMDNPETLKDAGLSSVSLTITLSKTLKEPGTPFALTR